jgi:hypothetical protein
MRIDQLEGRILSHAYELYDEACRDLRVGKNLKTKDHADARRPTKAANGSACGEIRYSSHKVGKDTRCRTDTKLDLRAIPIRSGSL